MFVWLQVIFFIITNAPALVKAIRDLIDAFGGDRKVAKSVLKDLRDAKRENPMSTTEDFAKVVEEIVGKYKAQV